MSEKKTDEDLLSAVMKSIPYNALFWLIIIIIGAIFFKGHGWDGTPPF